MIYKNKKYTKFNYIITKSYSLLIIEISSNIWSIVFQRVRSVLFNSANNWYKSRISIYSKNYTKFFHLYSPTFASIDFKKRISIEGLLSLWVNYTLINLQRNLISYSSSQILIFGWFMKCCIFGVNSTFLLQAISNYINNYHLNVNFQNTQMTLDSITR